VNFDLPWAIIRLIQRAGRVDRIGQEALTPLIHAHGPGVSRGASANIPAGRISRVCLALICGQFSEDTIPLTTRPTKRAASAPVSNCGEMRQRTCRNLSPFATVNLPPFAAFSRRLLSHGRLTPCLNQGFLSTQRPRFGRGVERC
jgi:hypothetical protein